MTLRFTRRFSRADSASLARRLLGQRLVRMLDDGSRIAGIIVETEAYLGEVDRAAHSFGGRRTPRNEAMYAEGGAAYVYFTYGLHFCFNVVAGRTDEPIAVLVRALEPAEGSEFMRAFRARRASEGLPDTLLCSGPARLCQALAIDRSHNGLDLTESDHLWIERGRRVPPAAIAAGPRIGIDSAGVWARKPLRFWIAGNPHVSR